ncbi:hypothetical protein BRC93_14550 [Halobacteriales archaeon QS_5_70_15]|nr:MAG: hypothetical protein BRC93_14550 [Halobacteriales archaeon QS_5_70_15]
MREVRTCDFCDEEAAGTFEVVPPERDPSGEGRRMVLCPTCRDTLDSVLEPLLDREGTEGVPETTAEPGTTTVVAEPAGDEPAGDEPAGDEPEPSPGDGAGGNGRDRGPASDGASPENRGPRGDVESGESGGEPTGGDLEEPLGGRPRSARSGTPSGYRKVVRFLEGREFPMDREEAETLAAEAYGIDRQAVAAAIDHAVKHDRLREAGGKLRQ